MTNQFAQSTIIGYPRIGKNRELKKALELYWSEKSDLDNLKQSAKELRLSIYQKLSELGLNKDDFSIPNSFSYYDQVLDASLTFGIIPKRFEYLRVEQTTDFSLNGADATRVVGSFGEKFRRPLGIDELTLNSYFTIARGDKEKGEAGLPGEMTKWFNTNYHYIVPEFHKDTSISLANYEIVRQFKEARDNGYNVRPTIIGPATLLALGKYEPGLTPDDFVPDLLSAYARLISKLATEGAKWIQLDEPALVSENIDFDLDYIYSIAGKCYHEFAKLSVKSQERPAILVTTPYAGVDKYFDKYCSLEVEALHFDAINSDITQYDLQSIGNKTVVVGCVDGHNVWRNELDKTAQNLQLIKSKLSNSQIAVATNTSLQHVPHSCDQNNEPLLNQNNPQLVSNLSFADEKVNEVQTLAKSLDGSQVNDLRSAPLSLNRDNQEVQQKLQSFTAKDFERESIDQRKSAQKIALNLPLLPTTTIGSFPQTAQIRVARAKYKKGEITSDEYIQNMKDEIAQCVKLQEKIGLDMLVHGEAERNDMVQYFCENFDGCDVTQNGWVQSYGSRCTKPSLIWGDVSRPETFTTQWISYAQSLTNKPMKGMLTGPVTILAWSFVRDDQPLETTAYQVALALREEIKDLEDAGIKAIQVDEPALRELLPLKKKDQKSYLDWSVKSFRLATSSVKISTQIHTHLCYSEFEVILEAIIGLNADVTSIEAARSKMEIVKGLVDAKYPLAVGPGIYDIHSPRIPNVKELEDLLIFAVDEFEKSGLDLADLWVNPDCGLKTRKEQESTPSLINMVEATKKARTTI